MSARSPMSSGWHGTFASSVAQWSPAAGIGVLVAVWAGPLPALASRLFAAHMAMHIAVVCVAAPLIAVGVATWRSDPVKRWPSAFSPLAASLIELLVVWIWHAPGPHEAARVSSPLLVLEQASFLAVGLLLWLSVLGGHSTARRERAAVGIIGLLLTSMHMTLLGVLLTVSPRLLYPHTGDIAAGLDDQRHGGLMMLLGGGTVYLIGALMLIGWLLRPSVAAPRARGARILR